MRRTETAETAELWQVAEYLEVYRDFPWLLSPQSFRVEKLVWKKSLHSLCTTRNLESNQLCNAAKIRSFVDSLETPFS